MGKEKNQETEEMTEAQLKELISEGVKEVIKDLKGDIVSEMKTEIANVKKDDDDKASMIEKAGIFIKDLIGGKIDEKAVDSQTSSFGYTVPTELANEILEKRDAIAKMRKHAFVFKASGNVQIPTEGTGVTGYWVGENEDITESNPTITKSDLVDYYLGARVLIPRKLLNTSAYNLVSYISRLAGRAIALVEETAFVGGDGSSKPTGFRTATVGSIAQAGANLASSDVEDLYYELGEEYRVDAVFATSTNGMKLISNLRSTDGKRLYPEVDQKMLKGLPLLEMGDIPSNLGVGTDETEIWIFSPEFYWIKDGEDLFVETDKNIKALQVEIVVAEAVDAIVTNADAFKKMTAVV